MRASRRSVICLIIVILLLAAGSLFLFACKGAKSGTDATASEGTVGAGSTAEEVQTPAEKDPAAEETEAEEEPETVPPSSEQEEEPVDPPQEPTTQEETLIEVPEEEETDPEEEPASTFDPEGILDLTVEKEGRYPVIAPEDHGVTYRVFVGQRSFGSCTFKEDGTVDFGTTFPNGECSLWSAYDDEGLKDPALYFEALQDFVEIAFDGVPTALWIDFSDQQLTALTQAPEDQEEKDKDPTESEDPQEGNHPRCQDCGEELSSSSSHLESCALYEVIPQNSEAYDFLSAFAGMCEKLSEERYVLPEAERFSFALNYLDLSEYSEIFASLSPDDSTDFRQEGEHLYLNAQLPLGNKVFTISVDVTAVEDHFRAEVYVIGYALEEMDPSDPQGDEPYDDITDPTGDPPQEEIAPTDPDRPQNDESDPEEPDSTEDDDLTPDFLPLTREECSVSLTGESSHLSSCSHYAEIPASSAAYDFLSLLPGMKEDLNLTSLDGQYEIFAFVLNYLSQEQALALKQAFDSADPLPEEEGTLTLRAENKVYENKIFTIVANVTECGGYYKVTINLTGYAD